MPTATIKVIREWDDSIASVVRRRFEQTGQRQRISPYALRPEREDFTCYREVEENGERRIEQRWGSRWGGEWAFGTWGTR